MKLKPFNPQKTPQNKLLLVCFEGMGFRIAAYRKLGDRLVWRLQCTGCRNSKCNPQNEDCQGAIPGDWFGTKGTYWCELPIDETQGDRPK